MSQTFPLFPTENGYLMFNYKTKTHEIRPEVRDIQYNGSCYSTLYDGRAELTPIDTKSGDLDDIIEKVQRYEFLDDVIKVVPSCHSSNYYLTCLDNHGCVKIYDQDSKVVIELDNVADIECSSLDVLIYNIDGSVLISDLWNDGLGCRPIEITNSLHENLGNLHDYLKTGIRKILWCDYHAFILDCHGRLYRARRFYRNLIREPEFVLDSVKLIDGSDGIGLIVMSYNGIYSWSWGLSNLRKLELDFTNIKHVHYCTNLAFYIVSDGIHHAPYDDFEEPKKWQTVIL